MIRAFAAILLAAVAAFAVVGDPSVADDGRSFDVAE